VGPVYLAGSCGDCGRLSRERQGGGRPVRLQHGGGKCAPIPTPSSFFGLGDFYECRRTDGRGRRRHARPDVTSRNRAGKPDEIPSCRRCSITPRRVLKSAKLLELGATRSRSAEQLADSSKNGEGHRPERGRGAGDTRRGLVKRSRSRSGRRGVNKYLRGRPSSTRTRSAYAMARPRDGARLGGGRAAR